MICARGALFAAMALLSLRPFPARADCRVVTSRADLRGVTIQRGARTWKVDVRGVDLTVRLDPGAERASVDVTRPLLFHGTAEAKTLAFQATRPIDLYDGRVRVGTATLGRWSPASGVEMKLSELTQLKVDPIPAVPCGGLRLANPDSLRSVNMRAPAIGAADRLIAGEVPLFAAPGAADPIRIAFSNGVGVVARRGQWARIQVDWDDGSRLLGWVQSHDLSGSGGAVRGAGSGFASAEDVTGCSDRPPLASVIVKPGADIFAAPGGESWAHVARPIPARAFPAGPDAPWVRLASLQVLPADDCSPLEFAWVRAGSVTAPSRGRAATPQE
jgi:hypothetical protein